MWGLPIQRRGLLLLLTSSMAFTACGSGPAPIADPETVAREEARLLAPFKAKRVVVCSHVRFTVTPNFSTTVSRPALDPQFHERVNSKGDGFREFRWVNKSGTTYPFTFTVEDTEFRVIDTATLKILEGRRALTMTAETGGLTVVHEGGRHVEGRDVAKFEIRDGQLRL